MLGLQLEVIAATTNFVLLRYIGSMMRWWFLLLFSRP